MPENLLDLAPLCIDCHDSGKVILDVLCDGPSGEPITYVSDCPTCTPEFN